MRKVVESRIPEAKQRNEYFGWASAPLFKFIEPKEPYCPSREEFFTKLLNTNYRDCTEVAELKRFCQECQFPMILLGHDKGVWYKLIPGNRLQRPQTNPQDTRPVVPDNVLRVNLHIKPKYKVLGRVNHKRHSANSHEFRILHQIGCI